VRNSTTTTQIQYSGHQIVPSERTSDFAIGLPGAANPRLHVFIKPRCLQDGAVLTPAEETPMENPTTEQIIHRAYQLWEQAGKPEGRDEEFYHEAEKELKGAQAAPAETPEGV
jgi:hypothetical protein